ncbi:MAG: hypothetical protein E7L01_01910 [Paenibacillus macerans]|uniref:hypothetical protein n=1 Tax=Paenibacillus TaxID=44249 RepID=UPI00290B0669|nr:hypothetical protein [Paenibacillus macerans]MDU7472105.1 hypothetical protein [Paenibacillus macerans]
MRYTLYIAAASDDHRMAYAYVLADYSSVVAEGTFLTAGERKFDESFCGHVALQRALRAAAKSAEGVVDLTVMLDDNIANGVGLELLEVNPPLYPSLCRATKRVMKRFNQCNLAAMKKEDEDLTPEEAAAFDDCLDALEEARTVRGKWRLLFDIITGAGRIIK